MSKSPVINVIVAVLYMNGDLAQMQLGRLVVNVEILLAVEDVGCNMCSMGMRHYGNNQMFAIGKM